MALRIFISHSVAPRELAVVYQFAQQADRRGITSYIPTRNWDPNGPIPVEIITQIESADAVVALGTMYGQHVDWLNREMSIASQKLRPTLFVLDPNVRMNGNVPRVNIDRTNLHGTISAALAMVEQMDSAKKAKDALTWLVVGGLLFMLFSEGSSK